MGCLRGAAALKTARAHQLGGRGVLPRRRSVPMERLRGMVGPKTAQAHQLGGQGDLPRQRSVPMERLRGTVVPSGPGPPVGGTGSPAQAAVGAYGGPEGDGSSQRPRPTSWGDGESCPGGG